MTYAIFEQLTIEQKEQLTQKLQTYLSDELAIDIGEFDATFLCEFIGEQLAPYFYNQGLKDAQAVLLSKIDNVTEAIEEIELVIDER